MANPDPEVTSIRTVQCRIVNPCDNLTPRVRIRQWPKDEDNIKRNMKDVCHGVVELLLVAQDKKREAGVPILYPGC